MSTSVPLPYAYPPVRTSVWSERLWPFDADAAAPTAAWVSAAVAGGVAAVTLRVSAVSIGYLVTGVALFAGAFSSRRVRPRWSQGVLAVGACALLGVGAVRASGVVFALCGLAACAVGSLAFTGGKTWTGLGFGIMVGLWVPARAIGWVVRGRPRARPGGVAPLRVATVVGVCVVGVAAFGGLFASADPAYSRMVNAAIPFNDLPDAVGRLVLLVAVGSAVLAGGYLLTFAPRFDGLAPSAGRPLRRWEWVAPLAVLDMVFASFVAVQLAVLFGGRDHVLRTAGLTYAEYARQGFWQLLLVTVLTLGVVALVIRKAGRRTRSDRILVRALLGGLATLALVVVASAAHRMALYEQAYGFTRWRLIVSGMEVWLGVVFGLVLLAGVRMSGTWLPRAVVGSAVAALLAFAAINPDAYVAAHNVERWKRTSKIDVSYLSTLSADAVPALDALPAELRACALGDLASSLQSHDSWNEFNLGRARARDLLHERPAGVCVPSR